MALSPQQRDALISAEQRTRAEIKRRVTAYVTTVWNGLGSWRDGDIERFVATILPRVLAGQQNIADLTDAYLSTLTGADRVGRVDLSQGLRNGTPPDEVYQRPAVEMRTQLAQGATFTDALAAGATRLASLVSTDLQLANTHQAARFTQQHGREFRRTLTGRENCALCVIASTQRYHRGNLMPIHPGCDCGIDTLELGRRYPQVIDKALLEATHEQVGEITGLIDRSARAPDYRKLIVTHDHGEYGPTLAWRGQEFTGPIAA